MSEGVKFFYLAGRFSRKDELAGYAKDLEAAGHTVTSRWLTGTHDATSERELTSDELAEFAYEDLDDIDDSDIFVLFTETPDAGYTSGGRMVEFGYAMNHTSRFIRVMVVGPRENVFTHILNADCVFPDWQAFREAML